MHRVHSLVSRFQSESAATALIAFLWLAIIELSIMQVVIVILTLTTIIGFGRACAVLCGYGHVGAGVGLVVGIGLQTFLGQLLLFLGIPPHLAHWIVLLATFAFLIIFRNLGLGASKDGVALGASEYLTGLSIALLVFSFRHPWILPFGIAVTFFERRYGRGNWGWRKFLSITITCLAAGLSWILRPEEWWTFYLNGDANHMESLSWSSAHWSILEQPGNSGHSVAAYHWLGHNFFGVLSHLAFLDPWVSMMNLGVPIVYFSLALLLVVPPTDNVPEIQTQSWIIALLVLTGAGFFRVDSFSMGIIVALGLIFLHIRDQTLPTFTLRRFALLCLINATLTFSKVTTSITVGILLVILTGIQFRSKNKLFWTPIAAYIATNALLYVFVFRNSLYSGNITQRFPPALHSSIEVLENTLLFPIFVILAPLWLIRKMASPTGTTDRSPIRWTALSAILIVLFAVVLGISGFVYHQRVGTPMLVILAALTAWEISATRNKPAQPSRAEGSNSLLSFSVLISALALAFIYPVVANRTLVWLQVDQDSTLGEFQWRAVKTLIPWLLLTAVGVRLVLQCRRLRNARHVLLYGFLCLAVLAGLQLDQARRVMTWGPSVYRNWPANDSPFPNRDLEEVGEWIRGNTRDDVLLASNNFCCFGNLWWKDIIQQIEDSDQKSLPMTEIKPTWLEALPDEQREIMSSISWGGDNYQTLAVTRRRFLMQGLSFQFGAFDEPTRDQLDRMSLSLDFASDPTEDTVNKLKSYGVSGYLVNLSLTANRDWSAFAKVKFGVGDFVYLELY